MGEIVRGLTMCDRNVRLRLKVPEDLNTSGAEEWKSVQVDACVADIVAALQRAGIDMRGSCCGHGRREGHVHLQDGRALLVLDAEMATRFFVEGASPLDHEKGGA